MGSVPNGPRDFPQTKSSLSASGKSYHCVGSKRSGNTIWNYIKFFCYLCLIWLLFEFSNINEWNNLLSQSFLNVSELSKKRVCLFPLPGEAGLMRKLFPNTKPKECKSWYSQLWSTELLISLAWQTTGNRNPLLKSYRLNLLSSFQILSFGVLGARCFGSKRVELPQAVTFRIKRCWFFGCCTATVLTFSQAPEILVPCSPGYFFL